jgi:UrcA family protein
MTNTKAQLPSRVGAAIAALAAVAFTAIGIAAGVTGQHSSAPAHSLKVAYAALDLSQPMGAQLLYRRLQQASSTVCGRLDQVDLVSYGRWQRCYDGTLQHAVLEVNAPQLLAVYHSDAAGARTTG